MITIATHSGNFHADDVFACAALQLFLGIDTVRIVRTREIATIEAADWVVDVGGVYDPPIKRFDHHQAGAPVRENGIPYAAFGLVWKEIGAALATSEAVAAHVDRYFIQAIDAADNGVSVYEQAPGMPSITTLSRMVELFRPEWGSGTSKDAGFASALPYARELIAAMIRHAGAREEARAYVAERYAASDDKHILLLDRANPVDTYPEFPELSMVISQNEEAPHYWSARALRIDERGFATKVRFPATWAGLRDEALAAVSGVPDAVFCHKGLFLAVGRSKEGALALAKQAV